MASEKYRLAILNHYCILLLAVFFLFGQNMSASTAEQSFQSSLDGSTSPETSKTLPPVPPKSTIEISDPDRGSVWTVSEPAKIEWKTENIDTSKSIRFFLAKNDMVVQELGSFENNFLAEGIELAKNVGSGDQYQVVGIELFPDNKFQVAKYATSYFSIRNPAADARKAAALAKRAKRDENRGEAKSRKNISLAEKGNPKKKRRKSKDRKKTALANEEQSGHDRNDKNTGTESLVRDEFEGRKISYVKELTFANEQVSVSLWDHGRQDGDIVSIYLNGETIISKHYLTYQRRKVSFRLDASKSNDLFLYAHNLGKAPPNTVSIELTDGTTSEKIVLNSDLKSCEAVQIKVQ